MPILGMNTHAKGKSASVAAAEGVFENFINEQCHIDAVNLSGIPSNILKSVNEVAHEHPMFSYAALVGSSEKHTDVSAYSDMDIKVHTRPGNIVTQRVRTKFIQEAKRRLELNKVTCFGYARKDAAVSFDCGCIEFDLVFTLPGLWCSEEKRKQLNTPNDDGVGDGFYNKPHLQRVVRALKLLIKLSPKRFPECSGLKLERYVLRIAKAYVDPLGFQLFVACLEGLKGGRRFDQKVREQWSKSSSELLVKIKGNYNPWTKERFLQLFSDPTE